MIIVPISHSCLEDQMGYISEVLRTVTGAEKALGVRWLCSVWWPWNNTEERAAPSAVGVRSKERSTRGPLSGRSWTSGADALMHTCTHTHVRTQRPARTPRVPPRPVAPVPACRGCPRGVLPEDQRRPAASRGALDTRPWRQSPGKAPARPACGARPPAGGRRHY